MKEVKIMNFLISEGRCSGQMAEWSPSCDERLPHWDFEKVAFGNYWRVRKFDQIHRQNRNRRSKDERSYWQTTAMTLLFPTTIAVVFVLHSLTYVRHACRNHKHSPHTGAAKSIDGSRNESRSICSSRKNTAVALFCDSVSASPAKLVRLVSFFGYCSNWCLWSYVCHHRRSNCVGSDRNPTSLISEDFWTHLLKHPVHIYATGVVPYICVNHVLVYSIEYRLSCLCCFWRSLLLSRRSCACFWMIFFCLTGFVLL